jgi:MYXO-CTERM domain-containing protein
MSLVSAVLAASFAGLSNAAITGVGGAVNWLGVNPANATIGSLAGPLAYAWNEQTGSSVSSLFVNLTSPGIYTGPAMNFTTTGGTFDSHIIHFDPGTATFCSGSVTFSGAIVAVIYDQQLLTVTDATLGALTTTYATSNPFRSFSGDILGSSTIAYSGSTLNFHFVPDPAIVMFEIRVLTSSVPAPGALALIGAGACVSRRRRS